MKKNNYTVFPVKGMPCYVLKKSFFYKRLSFLFLFFTLFTSSFVFSQEIVMSGLENVHVSEGAAIIIKKEAPLTLEKTIPVSENKKIVSGKKVQKKTEPQIVIAKKTKKIISDKTINQIKSLRVTKIVYSSNRKSDEAFSIFNGNLFKATPPTKDDISKTLFVKNEIHFISFISGKQQNILYHFYHSKNVEDFLFARPPPSALV